jgi:hypothetical protein
MNGLSRVVLRLRSAADVAVITSTAKGSHYSQ